MQDQEELIQVSKMDDELAFLQVNAKSSISYDCRMLITLCVSMKKEYCPPIDSALFFAIISDYDLSEATAIQEARATLDALKQSAESVDDTAFDPSGSSRLADAESAQESHDRAQSWNGDVLSRSEETDLTSVSQPLDSLHIYDTSRFDAQDNGGASGQDYDIGLEDLSPEDKQALLLEMFPTMRPFDISFTLKKSRNDFGKTVEELLNHVFLEDEHVNNGEATPTRGIDGFLSAETNARGRKLKGKKRKRTNLARRSSSTPAPLCESSPNTSLSKWDLAKRDVDFIAQRTYLPPKTITSMYHESGASLPTTILALCALPQHSFENPHISSPAPQTLQSHTHELGLDFSHLPMNILKALIELTHPSTASAHELASALDRSHSSKNGGIQVIPRYARPELSTSPSPPQTPTAPAQTQTLTLPPTLSAPAHAAAYATARNHALGRASAAYRASRSQPLMSAAASYYSQVSRNISSQSLRYASAAASALVASHSTPTSCDLHGVNVKDGVRIARERVEVWWNSEGEWAREGKVRGEAGFRIVVGVGRHSEGGKGRLGPAVGAMLKREGWRSDGGSFEGGVLIVRGRILR
ncbi:hypothetical protein MMC06_001326 [Schaereria dolodes]|nr:hypothetical protein [Schaereria dolodes]